MREKTQINEMVLTIVISALAEENMKYNPIPKRKNSNTNIRARRIRRFRRNVLIGEIIFDRRVISEGLMIALT